MNRGISSRSTVLAPVTGEPAGIRSPGVAGAVLIIQPGTNNKALFRRA